MKRTGFALLALLITISCKNIEPGVYDTFDVLRLKSGQLDSIYVPDLFYAPDYVLHFEAHESIDLIYDGKEQLLAKPDSGFSGLTSIRFNYAGSLYDIPVRVMQSMSHTFTYKAGKGFKNARVIGQFNSWNRNSGPMIDPDGDGIYEITYTLDPGRYEYKFYINDGEEVLDPSNPVRVPNPFGDYNNIVVVPDPDAGATVWHMNGHINLRDTLKLNFISENPRQELTDPPQVLVFLDNNRLEKETVRHDKNAFQAAIPINRLQGQQRVLVGVFKNGTARPYYRIDLVDGQPAGGSKKAFSWRDAIIYSLFIDRFYDADPSNTKKVDNPDLHPKANYHGGDLAGVLAKLEEGYFSDLGVNVLWISPVNQNPREAYREFPEPKRLYTGYHGYWPIEPDKVDERFGDMGLLQKVVETAHSRDMKVILDFVSNQVHEKHPWFKEHPDWFGELNLPDGRKNIRFWDEYRLTTWFDTFLPSFDFPGSPRALEAMTDNAVWWMQKTGVDGFRQDAVKHVPNTFWRTLTRKIKEEVEIPENKTTYQIGETFGGYELISSYVKNGQLDAQFNFNLFETANYTFLHPDGHFRDIDKEMHSTFNIYGRNHLMGNLMDSHDKVRFAAYADGDLSLDSENAVEAGFSDPPQIDNPETYKLARVYLAYMLTIPGMPVIYYGDEILMTGAADPDNRRPMRFGEQLTEAERKMKEEVSRMIRLRRDNSALRYGDFKTVFVDKDIYAYLREDMRQRILVLLNKGKTDRTLQLKLPPALHVTSVLPLYNNKRFVLFEDALDVDAPALSAQVFLLKN